MRKKITLVLFLITSTFTIANAQNWGGGIDEEDYNWGFSFQYISSEYKIIKKQNWRSPYFDKDLNQFVTDSLMSVSSPASVGFGIGFVVNTRLTENLDVRFTPTLVFSDRLVDYKYKEPAVYNTTFSAKQQKVQATMVELPLGIKIKSDRRQNFRAYLLLGGKYGIDMASGKKANDAANAPIDKFLKNKKSFLSYEGGIGFDLYFEYFKMSPEIKLSYSLKDVLKHEDHPYSTPIEKAILRSFTFSLFFE
jgi:hypothetical protein